MKDRTFGRYVQESRELDKPVLARTSGDVTLQDYISFLNDYTPYCTALYVALPRLNREAIFALRDAMAMSYRDGDKLKKRIPHLYLITRGDEESGNALMLDLAKQMLYDRVTIVALDDVSQGVIAMDHPSWPFTILGTIPVEKCEKGRLHVITIAASMMLTEWLIKAVRTTHHIKD